MNRKTPCYQWILFDVDHTLLRFDSFAGLRLMFFRLGIKFTKQDYQTYKITNQSLWQEYLKGVITSEQLQHQRMNSWARKLNISADDLNKLFIVTMAELCTPMEGARNLLNALKGKAQLGIITNGFVELQNKRLEQSGFKNYFEFMLTSEVAGITKPHPDIFEQALSLMNHPARDQVLMVGDSAEFDMRGGLDAGFDTCWLNAAKKLTPKGLKPLYQVASLRELEILLLGASVNNHRRGAACCAQGA